MWNFLTQHPRLTISMCVVGCIPLADSVLKRKATEELIRPVYAKMEVGSKPTVPLGRRNTVIDRPEVLEEVKVAIGFSQRLPAGVVASRDMDEMDNQSNSSGDLDKGKGFCVIVGPSGTGKTVCVAQICNESPKGALYFEIVCANSFTSDLAKEICMKIEPSGVIDLVLGYISNNYKLHHELPEDKDERLSVIMNVLQKAAKVFQARYKKIPVLFIDGIDVLAKKDEELVTCILSHAKYLANQNILKIVLISSEGSVMQIIRRFSGANRAPKIFEVVDVDDSRAIEFLNGNGLPDRLSKMLIDYFGGRLIYMVGSITQYNFYVKLGMRSDTEVYDKIISDLFARKLEYERYAISQKYPKSQYLLDAVSKDNVISPSVLLDAQRDREDRQLVDDTIAHLVDSNVLRYATNGLLTWNGKVEERHFKVQS